MRYRVEKFRSDGRYLGQSFIEAENQREAESVGMELMGAQMFRLRSRSAPYIHVTLSPDYSINGPCTRCGSPRHQCGGEADPHE